MAKSSSSVYGFSFKKNMSGLEHPATLDFLLDDSATLAIGDAVRIDTDGFLKRAGAGAPVLGILVGIVDQNGINVFSPRASGVTGSTLTPDDTITTSSTNTSDGTRKLKGQVIVDPAGNCLFLNDTDATHAQTNLLQCFDVDSSSGRITGSGGDTGQFQLIALPDPDDLTLGLFKIHESQLQSYTTDTLLQA